MPLTLIGQQTRMTVGRLIYQTLCLFFSSKENTSSFPSFSIKHPYVSNFQALVFIFQALEIVFQALELDLQALKPDFQALKPDFQALEFDFQALEFNLQSLKIFYQALLLKKLPYQYIIYRKET